MTEISFDNEKQRMLRGGFTIFAGQECALEELTRDLEKKIQSLYIMIADTAGQPILQRGELDKNKLLALGSVVAGDLAASQETARIIGQYESYQLIIREGLESNLFISEIGKELVLLCLVPTRTPLGWSRLLVKESAKQIAEIISTPENEIETLDIGFDDEKLAELYGDSLGSIWNG